MHIHALRIYKPYWDGISFTPRRAILPHDMSKGSSHWIASYIINQTACGLASELSIVTADGASCCPRSKSPSPLILGGEEANVVLNDLTAIEVTVLVIWRFI